jgi:type IV pilus assembly protein PilQ
MDTPIGIEIKNIPYDKALVVLVQYVGLIFEEKEDVIIVKKKIEGKDNRTPETYASVDSREVKISAVFFELDVAESRQRGIDWKVLLSKKGLDLGGQLGMNVTEETVEPRSFELNASSDFEMGDFLGEATAIFKFFEDENIGEIIASPNIVVRDRNLGRIQVGSDFSVKQRDFAGNVVESFFPTGTIIEVTPYVYKEDEVEYMLLNIKVERSSFNQNETTTEIRKSQATTQVVMLNGEESVLGGLFVTDDTKIRNGIPFLKDLPWWVFGIRYLTGSDETVQRKKELVILLKAELIPTLKERLAAPKNDVLLKQEIKKNTEKIKYLQLNGSESRGNQN